MKQLVKKMNVAQQSNQQTQPPMTQPNFTPQYQYGQGQQYYTPYLATNGAFPPQSYQLQDWNNPFGQRGGRGGSGRRRNRRGGRGGGRRKQKYCWTHGLCSHNGKECTTPAQGHQEVATLENRMGGSNKNA